MGCLLFAGLTVSTNPWILKQKPGTSSLRREQEPQHRPHPPRPARLIVRPAMHLLKVHRLSRTPPIGLQPSRQMLHIPQRSMALAVTYVEPHPWPLPHLRGMLVQVAQYAFVVPPHARRQQRPPPAYLRVPHAKKERT